MNKGSKLYSILTSTCPRCHESKVFTHHIYKITKMTSMLPKCPTCGQSTEPEPMFFTGAMYVSYAFSIAIVAGTFIGFNIFSDDPSPGSMVLIGTLVAICFAPVNLRLSRMIWFNVFVKFDPKANQK